MGIVASLPIPNSSNVRCGILVERVKGFNPERLMSAAADAAAVTAATTVAADIDNPQRSKLPITRSRHTLRFHHYKIDLRLTLIDQ